jgi:hypothetical protein
MSVKNVEYSFGVDNFKKPVKLKDNDAIGARLMELIMMEPGDDPLHPDMGVGLKTYRYGVNNLNDLKKRVETQIATYLPFYQGVNVAILRTPDKICNIEINIGEVTYVYDSAQMSKPVTLDDVQI